MNTFIPLENGVDLPLDPLFLKLPCLTFLFLPVGDTELGRNAAATVEHLVQKLQDLLPSSFGYDGIRQLQTADLPIFKPKLCLVEHIGRQHAAAPQFLGNALPVLRHQGGGGVLLGQAVFFFYMNLDHGGSEQLLLDLVLHVPDLLLLKQMAAEYVNVQKIPRGIGGDLLHFHIRKQHADRVLHF